MNLVDALRFNSESRVAFTGAGGKTSAIFAIARQWGKPVIVSTTTHLAAHQASLADQHIVVTGYSGDNLEPYFDNLPDGITLITGPSNEDDRLMGLSNGALKAIESLATKHHVPLLIEADGAKERLLKAPAEHEPAFPDIAIDGVVVASLGAIGKPLDEETVHRPEQFAALANISIGDTLTREAFVKVLADKQGGLKNFRAHTRAVVLLNQVDSDEKKTLAQGIAKQLVPPFHAVVAADIPHYSERRPSQVHSIYEPIAAILLAAGESKRLGEPKQLLDWHGQPFIRHIAKTALEAGLSPVVVVLGAHEDQIRPALQDLAVDIVYNTDWAAGQSSSVKMGLTALPKSTGAAIFLLVDQPQVPITLLNKLVATHRTTLAPIIAPEVDGQRGNPVLFDRSTFADLGGISGDVGGRAIFSRHQVTWIPWLDASLALDVDTWEDYDKLLNNSE